MNFSITSYNFKRLLTPLFAVFLTSILQAQNQSNSPYSRFGVGDLQDIQTTRNVGMGGLSVGLVGTSNLTSKNPASYMHLDSLMVNFNVSMYGRYSTLYQKINVGTVDEKTENMNTNSASLGQISFAFPITSWLKSNFGLTPMSNMSYDVTREYYPDSNIGKVRLNNYGHGGLNQVFVGFAAGTSRISVGVNANYQFGTFTRNATFSFHDTVLTLPRATEFNNYVEARGLFFDFGLQYRQPISSQYQLGLGFTYTPKYSLNATRNSVTLTTFHSANSIDPIFRGDTVGGTLRMPDMYTFGLSFTKLNRWVVGADYSVVNFQNYREVFGENTLTDPYLSTAQTFRIGTELIGRRLDNNFFNRMSYRFGYHYGTSYVAFRNEELTQYGVSFGFGMPIKRSLSRLDFAVEIGRSGNMNNGQIQENYGRIVVGISAFDRWFMRGRFD